MNGASIDSRTLQPGDVFYAVRGERDGHEFVEAALARGAARAVIAASHAGRYGAELRERLEVVADPLAMLQERAQAARRAWGGPVIGITGSAGKTTTKEMLAAALGTRLRVLKNEGNLNNHLGVPLTLLRLAPEHEVAVIEMGMNHAGEIARLAAIAEPTMGVFTNVGAAHLGNFASVDAIGEAKRELARAIPASGTLVLNADDARVARFGEGFAGRVVMYRARDFTSALQYAGEHHRANAAAALAASGEFGIAPAAAAAALERIEPPPGRGQTLQQGGMTLIHDCYNANPPAMEQMLRVLAATPGARHVAVLGEMRELGAASAELHREVGRIAAQAKVDSLMAVGDDARYMIEGAHAAGFKGEAAWFADAEAAGAALPRLLRRGDAVLFKASRGVRLERALARVMEVEQK